MCLEIKKVSLNNCPTPQRRNHKTINDVYQQLLNKEYNLQELGEGGDGSEVGGCIEDDRLLDLDHPGVPLLLVWLTYECVHMNIYVHYM